MSSLRSQASQRISTISDFSTGKKVNPVRPEDSRSVLSFIGDDDSAKRHRNWWNIRATSLNRERSIPTTGPSPAVVHARPVSVSTRVLPDPAGALMTDTRVPSVRTDSAAAAWSVAQPGSRARVLRRRPRGRPARRRAAPGRRRARARPARGSGAARRSRVLA